MQEIVVNSVKLHDFAQTLCEKAGLSVEDAETIAKHQVLTDLRGVHSHGTRALPGYLNLVLDGKMKPKPELRIETEGPSFAVIDGDNGMGHLASTLAMETAIAKAKTTGIAAAGVRNARAFRGGGMLLNYGGIEPDDRVFDDKYWGSLYCRARRCGSCGCQQRDELCAAHWRWTSDCTGYGVWRFGVGENRHTTDVWQTDSRRLAHR